jgi:hypothetical protein
MKKKTVKKIVVGFAVTIVSLVGVAGLMGYLFRDRIHEYLLDELGRRLNARIEIDKTDISFLRSFPDVSVEVTGLRINQREKAQRIDFINVPHGRVRVDFWSFFGDQYEIQGVTLHDPEVNCIRYRNGDWNFGEVFQVPPDTSGEVDTSTFVMNLDRVVLEGGRFAFHDSSTSNHVRIDSIFIDLTGDLREDGTEADGEIALRMQEWQAGKLSLFSRKHIFTELHLSALYDEKQKYELKDSKLRIAEVELALSGKVQNKEKGWHLDLSFASSNNSFASFLSLLPGGLLETGREYEYDGLFDVKGNFTGYMSNSSIPVLNAQYSVRDGRFRYKDYQTELRKAQLKGKLNFDFNHGDQSYLVVDELKASLNEKQVQGRLDYRNFNDATIDMMLFGDLNLHDLQEFYPSFADSSDLRGDVFVDMKAKGRVADFQAKNYTAVEASGRMDMTEVSIADPRLMHPVRDLNGSLSADNQRIYVTSLFGKVGSSDFDLSGAIQNYLPWLFGTGERLRADLTMKSKVVNLNEWLQASETGATPAADAAEAYQFRLPENMDVTLSAQMGKFEFDKFKAANLTTQVGLTPDALTIHSLHMETQGGLMDVSGTVKLLSPEMIEVSLNTDMRRIDMHEAFNTFEQIAAFATVKDNLYGTLSEGNIQLTAKVNNKLEMLASSIYMPAKGHITGGRLVDYEPLNALAGFIKVEKLKDVKFSDIDFDFRIEKEMFIIPRMKVQANEYKMEIEGRHGFDNTLNYRLWVELPGKEARSGGSKQVMEWIETDPANEAKIRIVLPIIVSGTVDEPVFRLDMKEVGSGIVAEVGRQGDQLSTAGAKETEQLFGEQDTNEVSDWIQEAPRDTTKKGSGWPKPPKIKNPFKKSQ